MSILSKFVEVYQRYADENAVLIYQFGKVGSTALEASLPEAIHQHSLYGDSPCHVHIEQRRAGINRGLGALGDLVKRVVLKRRKQLKIISIVREPVARNQSMFFQDLGHWLYKYVGLGHHDTREAGFDYLLEVYDKSFDHDYMLDWFEKEFRRFTGIDIYAEAFDKNSSFHIIQRPGIEVLLLKYEQLGENLEIIADFCGCEVALATANVGSTKWYADVYKNFKERYIPSDEYLNHLYKSKYMRAFYTKEEIDGFRSKYQQP